MRFLNHDGLDDKLNKFEWTVVDWNWRKPENTKDSQAEAIQEENIILNNLKP